MSPAISGAAPVTPAVEQWQSKSPLVVVAADTITLDGEVAGDPKPIVASQRFQRVDPLFAQLKSRRDGKSSLHDLWVDGTEGDAVATASALQTAAFAGFTTTHIKSGVTWVTAELPTLPSIKTISAPSPLSPFHRRPVLSLFADEARISWQMDAPCNEVPDDAAVPYKGVGTYLSRVCGTKKACLDGALVQIYSELPFQRVSEVLSAARSHAPLGFRIEVIPARSMEEGRSDKTRVCGAEFARRFSGGSGIPAQVVQSIVRSHEAEYRACFQAGLARDPKLEGVVRVKFAIDADGHVPEAEDVGRTWRLAGSERGGAPVPAMPDRLVVDCVVATFRRMQFPKPPGDTVRVTYPLFFSPPSD